MPTVGVRAKKMAVVEATPETSARLSLVLEVRATEEGVSVAHAATRARHQLAAEKVLPGAATTVDRANPAPARALFDGLDAMQSGDGACLTQWNAACIVGGSTPYAYSVAAVLCLLGIALCTPLVLQTSSIGDGSSGACGGIVDAISNRQDSSSTLSIHGFGAGLDSSNTPQEISTTPSINGTTSPVVAHPTCEPPQMTAAAASTAAMAAAAATNLSSTANTYRKGLYDTLTAPDKSTSNFVKSSTNNPVYSITKTVSITAAFCSFLYCCMVAASASPMCTCVPNSYQ